MQMKAARNEIGETSSLEHYVATQANFASIATAAMSLAMIIVLFGAVVLISCYAEDDYRKILADLIAVQGSTAVGFILAGSALYMQCLNVGHSSRRLAISARIVALLLLLLGAGFLLQNVFGLNLLGDRLPGVLSGISLAHSAFGAAIHPLAAGSFVLIALTLLIHDWRVGARHYPAEYLAFILIGLSAIPLVGYLYGVNKLTFLHYSTGIPFLSALVFLLLGAALLMARPSHRLMAIIVSHAPGGNMLRRLLPSMLALILIFNLLVAQGAEYGLYADRLMLPFLTLIDGALVVFIFWRFAGRLDREYGARMQSAAKLAETNSLLTAVSDSTREPIFVKNRQGLLVFANPAMLQQVGKTWEEAMYRASPELFSKKEDADRIDEDDKRVMASGLPETIEQTLHLPHGVFTYQSTRVPWFDKLGNVLGVIGISTDISERKRAEDSLREREAQLEKTVIERTALLRELTNHLETVREEEKRAIARELHDNMGASLTALSMHLESVYKILPDDEKWQERKPRIQGLMNSLVGTTRRIQTELRPNMLDLFGLKAAITEQMDELAERSGMICKASLPDEDVAIGHQMEIAIYRMLQEMLNNVTKHAKATQVDVILDVDEEQVALTVRDNGVGISQDRRDNNKTYGLRGLRERATFFGGEVDIRSTPGSGSLITIRLPVAPPPSVPTPAPASPAAPAA
ncbi:histidine kinase [Herbaspirillum sp. meg3]|uniref:PAS domain-containing sensor histidine kinase n=1 Tax=Herbaspirillum sp. meg3 TaxID=2025949 RepID=UPI000B98AACB|nr:PAS domain-containing protein [Herbaspirillum sp. meg3]ASU40033.1 histidine kinase [Herbaspirillum sp. meg3]